MLKIINSIRAVIVTHLKSKLSFLGISLLIFSSGQSLLMAQPITNGGLDNEMYFEEVQTTYSEPVSDPNVSYPPAENSGYTANYRAKESGNGFLMIAGAAFFGFITLLFLKIAAKNKVILLIIGLITLLIMNAQAQPESPELNNQAFFGEVPGRVGPTSTYSSTAPLGPAPPPGVPIDGGLAILAIAGLSVGVYSIYSQNRKN